MLTNNKSIFQQKWKRIAKKPSRFMRKQGRNSKKLKEKTILRSLTEHHTVRKKMEREIRDRPTEEQISVCLT